jgi:predicted lipid-binding transport protein (Tim44 family)
VNSVHRVGVAIAGIITLATIAGSLLLQGFLSAENAYVQSPAADVAAVAVSPQIIYVQAAAPSSTPQKTPADQPTATPVVQTRIAQGVRPVGDDDGGSDR